MTRKSDGFTLIELLTRAADRVGHHLGHVNRPILYNGYRSSTPFEVAVDRS